MRTVAIEGIPQPARGRKPGPVPATAPAPARTGIGARIARSLRRRGQAAGDQVPSGPADPGLIPRPRPGPILRPGPTPFGVARPGELHGIARLVEERFGHLRLDERYELTVTPHDLGIVHHVTHRTARRAPTLPNPAEARAALEARLDTIFGIGPITADRLRSVGVTSVRQLTTFERYRAGAREVVAEHDDVDLSPLCTRLARRLGERGHLLSTLACALVPPEDVVFFDLETMGLWNNVIFLAGVGRVYDGELVVDQYLAPGFAGEAAVVAIATAALAGAKIVVTYNGRTADIPWLKNRAFYLGTGVVPDVTHVDLMYGTRGRFVRQEPWLPSAKLTTVSEQLLGLPRPDVDIDSAAIPSVYDRFAQDPERLQGMLVPILDHNRADLEALVLLLERLCAEAVAA